jgi:hypothetical protein
VIATTYREKTMTTSKRITVKIGKYTGNDGKEKNRYKNIGELITKDDGGQFIKIDSTILNAANFALMNRERSEHIICSLFSDDDKPATQGNGAPPGEDDIPF